MTDSHKVAAHMQFGTKDFTDVRYLVWILAILCRKKGFIKAYTFIILHIATLKFGAFKGRSPHLGNAWR